MIQGEKADIVQHYKELTVSPFVYGCAVEPKEFIGREREVRLLFSRLSSRKSIAIIGQPHIGKTSFFKYIMDEQMRQNICGDQFKQCLFSYLDAQLLSKIDEQTKFWEEALKPLTDRLKKQTSDERELKSVYKVVQKNQFGNFVLEQLFNKLHTTGLKLILLLDEFDVFLSYPKFHSAEFYGGLRSLASRCAGFTLVIASRRNREQLTEMTQEINPYSSPYFNIFSEIRLGAFSEKDTIKLLSRIGDRFTQNDHQFIRIVTGMDPYLLQVAADKLWEAQEEGLKGFDCHLAAGREIYNQTKEHFAETWKSWSVATRKAVTVVALAQIPFLLSDHKFRTGKLIENLNDYSTELETLEASGIVAKEDTGEWNVTQGAFLWWLANELRSNLRDETDFKTWLQNQKINIMLTKQEQEKMRNAIKKVLQVIEKGVTALIEAFAKGIGNFPFSN